MAGGAGMKQGRAATVQAEDAAAAAPETSAQDEMAQRFLAVRQELNVEVPQAQLADAWGQVRDLCATLRCELLSASLLRERSEEHTSELQSRLHLVCRLLLEKKKHTDCHCRICRQPPGPKP